MEIELYKSASVRNQAAFFAASLGVLLSGVLVACSKYELWGYPILMAAPICCILVEEETWTKQGNKLPGRFRVVRTLWERLRCVKCRALTRRLSNDVNHNLAVLASFLIVIPCAIFFLKRVAHHIQTKTGSERHEEVANDFGKTAVAAMSMFLIPVSQHSVILKAAGIGEIHALRLHIWAGVLALCGGLIHGLYYFWIWFYLHGDSLSNILPNSHCWTRGYGKTCHKTFVNLLGIICGTSFILLGFTSLWWVRRNFYRTFYFCHIFFSILLMFGLVMHYNKMILYLVPSLLYYMASNVPALLQWTQNFCRGAVSITNVMHIPNSGGCVELSLRLQGQRLASDGNPIAYLCGKHIKMMVPEISFKSHSFTVFSDSPNPEEFQIIFRTCGSFTTRLSKRLQIEESEKPNVIANGLHSGSRQLAQALYHDTIVIFAGGVGIVSYISLLAALQSILYQDDEKFDIEQSMLQESNITIEKQRVVHVHWMCRDNGLIDYLLQRYFTSLVATLSQTIAIKFTVYHTCPTSSIQETQNSSYSVSNKTFPPSQPTSPANSGGTSMLRNFLPSITFASIAWGGMWIIKYCYSNIQHKRVVETRPIAVAAIISWSIIVSIVFFLAENIGASIHSKFLYSKIENDTEIELAQQTEHLPEAETPNQTNTVGENSHIEANIKSKSSIFHCQGRPNIYDLIEGALKSDSIDHDVDDDSIGVFVCGPTPFRDCVRSAVTSCVKDTGGSSTCCLKSSSGMDSSMRTGAIIYEEKFEM